MREILFRAYDTYTKTMLHVVDAIKFTKSESINIIRDGAYGVAVNMQYQPHIILMQYTGLKDKNGKEIYEGDIVQFIYRNVKFIGEIKYGVYTHSKCDEYNCHHYGYYIDTQWEAYCKNTGFDLYKASKDCECEVIGNIYENPELLKGE